MNIPMALLADEANVSQEGKLNMLGMFDRIAAFGFPMAHPRMVFAFRVQTEYADSERTFSVRVRLVDDDGGVLFEAAGELTAPPVSPGEFFTANQVFSLVGVRFMRPGTYKFVVNLADLAPHETLLSVVQATWPGAEPEGPAG